MLESLENLDFRAEAFEAALMTLQIVSQNLHRHQIPACPFLGQPDRPHTSVPELPLDLVVRVFPPLRHESSSFVLAGRQSKFLLAVFQVALELHYWGGLNAAEIAKVLAVPHSTMRSRLGRAGELLERAISELGDSPELSRSTLDGLDLWAEQVRAQLG